MTQATARSSREPTAERLLNSSARNSYDPEVDIDWSAPIADDRYFLPPERLSLYGTDLWRGMSEAQRIELSKHELCSIASVGIWFEVILMEVLSRYIYERDPLRRHVQYALVEIADECRHSVMFARSAEKLGVPSYQPPPAILKLGKMFAAKGDGASAYAAILVAEEILDIFQRDLMKDERVLPLIRAGSQIHVVEEARHMRFAREEIARRAPELNWLQRRKHRTVVASVAAIIADNLVQPQVYAAVGLDPDKARATARANEQYRAKLRGAASGLVDFLREVGLIGGPSELLWKRSGLL
jgi:P-aminobenzoate N-oxygenase AurF